MNRRWMMTSVATLAGCSLLPQTPYVQQRAWPLDVRRPSVEPRKVQGYVLLVRSIRAAPGLDDRGLQWLQRDGSVHVDFYEQWSVPPAQAMEDDLRQWLADSGLFTAVVAPGSRLNADLVLEGELDRFIADPPAGVVRVALAVVLLDQRRGSTKVLLQRTESAQVELPRSDPPAIAGAMRAGIAELLRRTEADVARAVR
jgi:cholesterol transport system auxiliary component